MSSSRPLRSRQWGCARQRSAELFSALTTAFREGLVLLIAAFSGGFKASVG